MIKSGLNLQHFRELTATMTNKLVRIPGIVISASVLSSRATKLHLQCRACRSIKTIHPPSGLGGMGAGGSSSGLPRVCDAPSVPGQEKDCPMDPYLIIHSKSSFTDHQVLKLQEAPDMVPIGDLPRHIPLSADRFLAGQIVPGTRVIATGVYSTYQSAKTVCSESPATYFWLTLSTTEILGQYQYTAKHLHSSSTLRGLFTFTWSWPQPLRCAVFARRRGRVR